MKNYYLPDNYPDTAKGARLYIKDIKASDKEKEEIRLTIKAVDFIINYNKNGDTQALINFLENDKDGIMLFSINLWDRFTSDVGDEAVKGKKERKARIDAPKRGKKFSKNKGDKYEIKYFIPEAYEDSADGMRIYFSDLIRNANTDEKAKEELLLTTSAMRIIDDYHYHKDKEALQDAIRNKPELFKTEIFTNFVADVNDGTYKPTKKYTSKKTEELRLRIVANVEYYRNMGFPLYYADNPNVPSACEVASKEIGKTLGYIEKIFKKYRRDKKNNKSGNWSAHVRDGINSYYGQAIWTLNGFRRPQPEEISQLEEILLSLTKDECKKVVDFSFGMDVKKYQLPTTQKELRKIKIILNKNKDYDFIKSLQIKEISVKP